jgi:hypothetical protein
MNWPAPSQTSLFRGYRLKDFRPQIEENDTWYELLAIDDISVEQLRDAAMAMDNIPASQSPAGTNASWGKVWQDRNAVQILTAMGHKPQGDCLLRLRTLDTNEIVELTVRVPEKN